MSAIAVREQPPVRAKLLATLAAALVLGVGLAWIDTRPGFDDTGVLVGLVFLSALGCTAFGRAPFAAVVLLVGGVMPAAHLAMGQGAASWVALLPALLGAGVGAGVREVWNRTAPR